MTKCKACEQRQKAARDYIARQKELSRAYHLQSMSKYARRLQLARETVLAMAKAKGVLVPVEELAFKLLNKQYNQTKGA